jgi:hypothetical protein
MSKEQIYYLIAQILSLDYHKDKIDETVKLLPSRTEDWQKWVQLGSKHLVLQSLYLSLKRNQVLSFLPNDLISDLEYLYQLNVERNNSLLSQAKNVRDLLTSHDIDCVFMKGTGNLFDGLYFDIGERMIYDIDILVNDEMMLKAAQLLLDNGYKTQKRFNEKAYPSTMHYPILLNEDCVAGVEIHRLPVQYHYLKAFNQERIFLSKKRSEQIDGFWVMSNGDKIIHNFMHSQLMHNGHYHADVSLRDLYDLLLLSGIEDVVKVLSEFKSYKKESRAYLDLFFKVFDLPQPNTLKKTHTSRFFMARHKMTLTLSLRRLAIYHFIITAFIKYFALPIRTLFDKNARNYVFARLSNRHWYKEHLESYFRH